MYDKLDQRHNSGGTFRLCRSRVKRLGTAGSLSGLPESQGRDHKEKAAVHWRIS